MRDYGVVRVRFWAWAKRKKLSLEARDLALYLLTCTHGNSLGCYRLPMAYMCDDLDTNAKALAKPLDELKAVGFLERDDDDGWTWIRDFLEHNPIPNNNVGKAIGKLLEQVPLSVAFFDDMLEAVTVPYVDSDLIETLRERYRKGIGTVQIPLNGSEEGPKTHTQTQEHDHEHNPIQEHDHTPVACATLEDVTLGFSMFNQAAKRTGWPEVQKIDEDRKRLMRARLKDAGGLEGFAIALGKAEASEFLTTTWQNFNLDWMLKPKNFRKLMEGNYANRSSAPGAQTGKMATLDKVIKRFQAAETHHDQ